MTEPNGSPGQRDRSPAYPNIALDTAFNRLVEFEEHFKRSGARPEKVGEAWGIKAKAYADRVLAALRYYGLLESQGTGSAKSVAVSEEGRRYLRAQQAETKRDVIKAAALRPKQLAKFWSEWGPDRPADPACLDDLAFKHGFSESGAREFLKVYDATIAFAGLSESDKIHSEPEGVDEAGHDDGAESDPSPQPEKKDSPSPDQKRKGILMEGERELTTGLLSKGASFRLIVSGEVGEKEIARLIKKLELDKEILAERDRFDENGEELDLEYMESRSKGSP